jgi:putative oxidoreductase
VLDGNDSPLVPGPATREEATCAVLVLVGPWTRLAALPLVTVMLVALSTTKIPLLWRATTSSARGGFWSMLA